MPNQNKFKIELNRRWSAKKRDFVSVPLPSPKSTNIDWDMLVSVLGQHGVEIAKEIRLHNVGQRNGTRKINRNELFSLWKCVEAFRNDHSL